MNLIEDELKDSICKDCKNVGFYDWFFCNAKEFEENKGKSNHPLNDNFLPSLDIKECPSYNKQD